MMGGGGGSYGTVPTYRRGRAYYSETGDLGGCAGVCSVLLLAILLAVPPIILFASESSYHLKVLALSELLEGRIERLSPATEPGAVAHGLAEVNPATVHVSDGDTLVEVRGALSLRRTAEYCQWTEYQREQCRTCTREVTAEDGSTGTETYDCDCVTTYDYVKSWMPYRVNSLLFDQAAAHHNPQRDPLPSATFVATGDAAVVDVMELGESEGVGDDGGEGHGVMPPHRAKTTGGKASPLGAALSEEMLHRHTRAAWRRVDWVPGGVPPKPSFFSLAYWNLRRDTNRYEPISDLRAVGSSPAARRDGFVYVGQGGYFFSPYSSSTSEKLMKYFFQYLEGTLLDWQLGDLMPYTCTAGDVRVSYSVQDPPEVSVLAQVDPSSRPARAGIGLGKRVVKLRTYRTDAGLDLGFVHAGLHGPYDMIQVERTDARNGALPPRLLLVPWAEAFCRLLGAFVGYDVASSSDVAHLAATAGTWCFVVGSTWAYVWGGGGGEGGAGVILEEAKVLMVASVLLMAMFLRFGTRAGPPPGFRAAWCMLGRWARVPPSWRVEKSYGAAASKRKGRNGDGRHGTKGGAEFHEYREYGTKDGFSKKVS